MVDAALEGEWDTVIEIERERSPKLAQLSATLADAEQSQALLALWRTAIISMIESDREITVLAEALKHNIAQGMSEMGSSRKAVNAYLDNLSL